LQKKRLGYILLGIIGIIAILGFAMSSPIEQNEDYHNFSDTLTIGGILNFWNVISNFPFLIVGLFGIFRLKKMDRVNLQFLTFFIGVSFVAIGSGYYHFNPNSSTLVWDRLPMTIAFTALMSIVISEFIDYKKGKLLLLPLLLLGIISIVYWVKLGDLRLYALVQFYPILAIPVILILFKSEENFPKGFWLLLISYIIAKLFETYDFEIHKTLKLLSGHSLKHISASVGVYLLINSYIRQNKFIEKQLPTKPKLQ
jgi:hypothetical protein